MNFKTGGRNLRENSLSFNWAARPFYDAVKGNRNNRNNWQLDTIVPLATTYPHLNLKSLLGIRESWRRNVENFWTGIPKATTDEACHDKYSYFSRSSLPAAIPRLSSHKIVAIARVSSTARFYLTSVPKAVSSTVATFAKFFMSRSIPASIENFRFQALAGRQG